MILSKTAPVVAEVGETLLNRLADSQSAEIRNTQGDGRAAAAGVDHGWDKAVAKVNNAH